MSGKEKNVIICERSGVERNQEIHSPDSKYKKKHAWKEKNFIDMKANKNRIKLICNNKFICLRGRREIRNIKAIKRKKEETNDLEKVKKNRASV